MAKRATDDYIDGGLDTHILSTNLTLCSAEPTTFAEITTFALATHTLTGGDWSKADGDVSGRKATMAQQASISVSTTGTGNHVVVDDGVDGYAATTCTPTAVTSGGTVTINAWDREIADPA